ncbi:MAG: glycosyltransferase family 9 protein [Betaproteobacteria bacterium]|nr:glycosyltransferase family 9 protein [Betaproteobacteria bacterium]
MISPPKTVLVVATRRIGDVLLATPLMRSVKRAWPEAALDALVFEGTQGVLTANPDVRRVLAIPERPGLMRHLAFALRLLRRYDLALSVVPGDRPTLYAFLAGKRRAGLLLDTHKERWKRRLLDRWTAFDDLNTHTVLMNLALADALGIERRAEVTIAWTGEDETRVEALLGDCRSQSFALLHTYPKFNYKMWHRAGWRALAEWLDAQGMRIVLSGGPDAAETEYVASVRTNMLHGTVNLAGKLTLAQTACLVSRARLFVGPDTAVTHFAAALGVPTVALFGPSNPVKWGPWPQSYRDHANPWRRFGAQRQGNVILLQGTNSCVPCLLEGCERHVASFSDCLQELSVTRVIAAAQELLGRGVRRT